MKTFVAIGFDANTRESLMRMQSDLTNSIRKDSIKSLVSIDDFHLTLRYIGESSNIESLANCLQNVRIRPFSLAVDSIGTFDNESSSVVWAGVCGDVHSLRTLKQQVDVNLQQFPCKEDVYDFIPHVTLLYSRDRLYLGGLQINPPFPEMVIKEISLYGISSNIADSQFQILRTFSIVRR